MKKNYTHWGVIIDRSGSMNSIKSAVIEGFNQMIEDQKKEPGELTVSLVQFDSNYAMFGNRGLSRNSHELVYTLLNDFTVVNEVQLLNEANYQPRGGTPLNDSVARFIEETGKRLEATPEALRPEKVIVTIMTDGQENTSTKHTSESVKAMIKHQEDVYGWKFIYVGANQDSAFEANSRGMSSSMNYDASFKGAKSALFASGKAMSKMRSMDTKAFAGYAATNDLNAEYSAEMNKPDENK